MRWLRLWPVRVLGPRFHFSRCQVSGSTLSLRSFLQGLNITIGLVADNLSCDAMPGTLPGGSTCERGVCVAMACEEGYYLVDGDCKVELD